METRSTNLFSENPRSISIRLTFGTFSFLDLGDLSWNKLAELVCPVNLLGHHDVYVVAHHANNDSNVAPLLTALTPRVAVSNNGPWKGGGRAALLALLRLEGLEDLWQLHRSNADDVQNTRDELIANPESDETDKGFWLKLSASDDGSFSITIAQRNPTGRCRARYSAVSPPVKPVAPNRTMS